MTNTFVGLESWTLARPELFLAGATALLFSGLGSDVP